jgi:hypothetical protein
MGDFNIKFEKGIHAEIVSSGIAMSNSPLILDPVTNSYSTNGNIITYNLSIIDISGVDNPVLLNNGKNSRFTASGNGTTTVELYIEDDKGNYDTCELIIKIG